MMSENNPGGATTPIGIGLDNSLRKYRRLGAHYRRYLFVREFCVGRKVLDFGCGYGFGVLILGEAVSEYVGVDLDRDAIEWANRNLAHGIPKPERVRFLYPEELNLTFPDGHFDAIISFEVIEHLNDPATMLKRLLSKLAPGGKLIISTPNGTLSRGNPTLFATEYHVHEYTARELLDFLNGICNRVQLLREDRIDRLNRIWRRKYARSYLTRMSRPQTWLNRSVYRLQDLVSTYLNGPWFWTISMLMPSDYESPDYSNIIAVLSK
ncbi:MAG: class I SAM-dependent methyltransferase [Nitrososphaerota archaeon]|jgi:2-polyprenyl-3-methyl-5-hydroxy-6-metoxy-1,4-benzoquinol methylase|nr:class I SAM-dependent methyltransferase [Nitrososphaerota archaeon]